MEGKEILRLQNVTKSFSGNHVLKDINFSLQKGEVRALVGENGAGKSTMIKVIAGAVSLGGGEIFLEGKPVHFRSPKESLAAGISVMYQELDLLPELTIAENIYLGIEKKKKWRTLDRASMNRVIDDYLKEMDLCLSRETKVKALPIVMQQMVAAIKAMVHDARIIIMDEPSSSLSNRELNVLFALVRKLKRQGIAVIYVSHHLEEIFEICDSVSVLLNGQMVSTNLIGDVTKEQVIEKMVGKSVSEDRLNPRNGYEAPTVLEADNITCGTVVKSVSFQVKKGEIYGILGLLGSGAIEVGKILYGMRKLDGGEIRIHGRKAVLHTPSDALRHSIAYVSDERRAYGIFREMDVEKNGMMTSLDQYLSFRPLSVLNRKQIRKVFMEQVQKMEIKITGPEQQIQYLSGGNQQKVLIARTLISDKEIIVLSSPTKGIDVGAKFEIYQILLDCIEHGKTVIVISQEITELVQICDRILMMKQGEVYREYAGESISEGRIYHELLE